VTSRVIRLAAIAALLCAMDAPLALIQGYAWAAMAWRSARGGSVTQALATTFDGKHPCAVCLSLRKASKGPSLRASAPRRLDMVAQPAVAIALRRTSLVVTPLQASAASPRSAAPPVPPPEALLS
jgi:hypothetical protein